MANRRIDLRRIKIHQSYTVNEAANILSSHPNTVRKWIKKGLPLAEERHPILLRGRDIRDFHQDRKAKKKCRLAPGEFYCFKCQAPKRAAFDAVDYYAISSTIGNLKGLCPDCSTIMNRRTSIKTLDAAKGDLEVTIQVSPTTPKREDEA